MHCSLFATILTFVHLSNSVPIDSAEPAKGEEEEQRQKRSASVVEFLMNDETRQNLFHDQNTLRDILETNKNGENSKFVCPEKIINDGDAPIKERSTCPWYYSVTHDPTRFPATVINAEPLCQYAIGSNKTYECSPITQTMTVLRQQPSLDDSDKYVWIEEDMTIVVGFTASGRSISTASEPTTTAAPSQNMQPTPEWN